MLQDLAEAIARPLFERVLQLFGYGSGRLAWPVLSLHAKARRDRPPRRPGQRRHGRPLFYRTASGSLVASDDAVRVLSLACWALLALAGFLLYRLAR